MAITIVRERRVSELAMAGKVTGERPIHRSRSDSTRPSPAGLGHVDLDQPEGPGRVMVDAHVLDVDTERPRRR